MPKRRRKLTMENSKRLKELEKQLTLLKKEIYADCPSGCYFELIMQNIDSLIEPAAREAYNKIWYLYNKVPKCCTDGKDYKDFKEGNIRDAILVQIYNIEKESNITTQDASLDIITKTDKCKTYFMLRYVYNDLILPKMSFDNFDGKWIPVSINYLITVKGIFESLKDYETTSLFSELLSTIESMSITPNVGQCDRLLANLCQAPKFPCVNMKLIDRIIARLKEKIDAETDLNLINATNGILKVMSFGKYNINNVRDMIASNYEPKEQPADYE